MKEEGQVNEYAPMYIRFGKIRAEVVQWVYKFIIDD